MPVLRLQVRVLALLAPERRLTIALAKLVLAAVYLLEPVLFGRVVDALRLIALRALLGFEGATSCWRS